MAQAQPKKDWREKYLDLVEIQDTQEQQFEAQLKQMRRALVHVSLAADGADPELDNVLAALREHLKSTEKQHQLHKRLAVVEEALIAFDGRKNLHLSGLQQSLVDLLDPLQALDTSRQTSKACKTLKNSLKTRLEHQQELPSILKELSELQSQVLNRMGSDKPGFMQKLLSIKNGGSDQQPHPLEKEDKEKEGAEKSVKIETNLSSIEEVSSARLGELGIIIREIVDLVDPSATENKTVLMVRDLLDQDNNTETIKQALQQVREIIRQAVTNTKLEFSEFLLKTNTELNSIAKILNDVAHVADEQNNEHAQLRANMQDQLQTLQESVDGAVELEQLKQQVNSQLETIREKIGQYDKPSNSLSDQLKQLLDKVEQFEKDAIETAKDLSEQKEKAQHDRLTGLYNREAYEERCKVETARWKRYENPLSIAVLDIDHFKKINDTYGHQAGDKVLRLIAQSLQKRLRDVDFIARFGGEEFVVLLPETTSKNAKLVMEKLRQLIADTPFHFRKQRVQITLSVGLSEFVDGDTEASVFSRADKALYQSKNNGRNCSTIL